MGQPQLVLLSLVGEQPIPNLLPLRQFTHYTEVQFVASATTRGVAKQLQKAIQQDETLQHLQALKTLEVPPYHIGDARTKIVAALLQHQAQGKTIHVNLTGGTKLMSLAALQAAYGSGVTLMYVSTEEKQIIWLASDGSEQSREPIQVRVDVWQYLNAHGLEVETVPVNPFAAPPPKEGDELEKQVYDLLKNSGLFDDVRRNLHIRKQNGKKQVRNELDVVVTRNGRMAVISCKSGNVESETGRRAYHQAIYELSAISRREAAGIYCGKVLVSSQPELPQALRDRAAESGVKLVYGAELENVVIHVLNAVGK
ncbi:MAG: DUF1887 family CARF protein [Anaerolineales bacterium]|nr:DUF1887 family CARF protein [Anaerolineales bacterium]